MAKGTCGFEEARAVMGKQKSVYATKIFLKSGLFGLKRKVRLFITILCQEKPAYGMEIKPLCL